MNDQRLHPLAYKILYEGYQFNGSMEDFRELTDGHMFNPMPESRSRIAELEKENKTLRKQLDAKDDVILDLREKLLKRPLGALEYVAGDLPKADEDRKWTFWSGQFLWVLKWILIGAGVTLGIVLFDQLVKWVAKI